MKLFELADLVLRRNARFELAIDEFSLEPGEKVAVVGPNGSGKTTLLRVLSFLEKPDSWSTFNFRDLPCGETAPDRDGLGFLRQQPYLFRGTVAQNLAYPLRLRLLPRTEIRARVHSMLVRMDIESLANEPARRLSGGEQRRVALGRALIADNHTILLDEPIAHLDARSRTVIEEVLRRSNATILLTTHDVHFAHRVADRVVSLKSGRLSVGLSLNILEGQVEEGRLVTRRGLIVDLPQATVPTRYGSLTVMIDPRRLTVSAELPDATPDSGLRGRISSIREQGNEVWLEIDCGDRLTAILSKTTYETEGLNLNSEVGVAFGHDAIEVL